MVVTSSVARRRPRPGDAVYTARTRSCDGCRADLPAGSPSNRILCDRCRERRRALTFLRRAQEHLEPLEIQHVNGAIEALIGAVELAR